MKILQVTETLHEGGAELFLLRLTRELRKKGVDASVLLLDHTQKNEVLLSHFKDIPIESIKLPMIGVLNFIDRLMFKFRLDYSVKNFFLQKKLKSKIEGADIIHSHHLTADYLLGTLKRSNPFVHVVTVHGDYSAQYFHHKKYGSSIWRKIDNKFELLRRSVDKWILISDEQVQFFNDIMRVNAEKIEKIWNGYPESVVVADNRFSHILNKDAFLICMVGRGVKEKGWELAIQAVRKLPKDYRLILIGDSEYLKGLKERSVADENIFFLGFIHEPVNIIRECDVLLMPTLFPYESLPNVIIESLSVGTPVIATQVGEIEKMITDETSNFKAGLLIDYVNGSIDVDQIVTHLKSIYSLKKKSDKIRCLAKKAFHKFRMENCVDKYISIYESFF